MLTFYIYQDHLIVGIWHTLFADAMKITLTLLFAHLIGIP